MYIVTNQENVIIACAISGIINNGIEIDEIPNEVLNNPLAYCYSKEQGFFNNPNYIPPNLLEESKQIKISELDEVCKQTIYAGTDVKLSNGSIQHFTLDDQDQSNLLGLGLEIATGAEMVSWHSSDKTQSCQFYSALDAQTIIQTLTIFKSYHITYFRDLRIYINSLMFIDDVEVIQYGFILPDYAKSDVLKTYEQLLGLKE